MSELPDVEVFRRNFDATSLKRKIQQIDVLDNRILDGTSENGLRDALVGTQFKGTRRHGKFMFARSDVGAGLLLLIGSVLGAPLLGAIAGAGVFFSCWWRRCR